MLVINTLDRVFIMKDGGRSVKLSDPNKSMPPQQVLNYYANTYSILTTAKIDGPHIENDKVEFWFVTTLGTKG